MKVFVSEHGEQLLPPNTDPKDGCNVEEEMAKGRYCFLSGKPNQKCRNILTHDRDMFTGLFVSGATGVRREKKPRELSVNA